MKGERLADALDILGKKFQTLRWHYPELWVNGKKEKVLYWPGDDREDIMICVLKDWEFQEDFHRHGFFFLNYAYCGGYAAIAQQEGRVVAIDEDECYIGQPFSGYALRQTKDDTAIILGVLVRSEVFYRDFLPAIASEPVLFNFFLTPQTNKYSEEFLHLHFPKDSAMRSLLELLVMEYAFPKNDTQRLLRPLVSSLLLYVARRFCEERPSHQSSHLSVAEQIIAYISEHATHVTLAKLAAEFSYHPNYISSLIRKKTGRSFSQILRTVRMERASLLLQGSNLSVEEIAAMLGYTEPSSFYKAFREEYHASPRDSLRNSFATT